MYIRITLGYIGSIKRRVVFGYVVITPIVDKLSDGAIMIERITAPPDLGMDTDWAWPSQCPYTSGD